MTFLPFFSVTVPVLACRRGACRGSGFLPGCPRCCPWRDKRSGNQGTSPPGCPRDADLARQAKLKRSGNQGTSPPGCSRCCSWRDKQSSSEAVPTGHPPLAVPGAALGATSEAQAKRSRRDIPPWLFQVLLLARQAKLKRSGNQGTSPPGCSRCCSWRDKRSSSEAATKGHPPLAVPGAALGATSEAQAKRSRRDIPPWLFQVLLLARQAKLKRSGPDGTSPPGCSRCCSWRDKRSSSEAATKGHPPLAVPGAALGATSEAQAKRQPRDIPPLAVPGAALGATSEAQAKRQPRDIPPLAVPGAALGATSEAQAKRQPRDIPPWLFQVLPLARQAKRSRRDIPPWLSQGC